MAKKKGTGGLTAAAIARKGKAEVAKRNNVLEELNIDYVALDSLKPNRYNPNRQSDFDFDLLMKSMTEDGFTQPIVVQRSTNEIVDGEHRWRAASKIGLREIPVVFVDMTEEQMKISTLRHNRARGSEDIDLSAQVLRDLRELGALEWAAESLQLDDRSLQRLLKDESAPEALANEEFGQSWLPNKSRELQAQPNEFAADGTRLDVVSLTPMAAKIRRDIEEKLEKATTHEEYKELNLVKNSGVFVLNLTFNGDEATMVKGVLAPNPAASVLHLCKSKLAAEGRLGDDGKVIWN